MTVSSAVETITPELATRWLEGHTHNRPLSQRIVTEYAQQMQAGTFVCNGETIIFDVDNVLLNGQHRLWACIEAQTPFVSVVVRGVPPETFSTIDTGKRRSPSDVLAIADANVKNRSHLAAAAKLVLAYRRGTLHLMSQVRPSNADMLSLVQSEPGLTHWVGVARAAKGFPGYASPVAAVLHLGSAHQESRAAEFAEQFCSGAGLDVGSPILALRNRFSSPVPVRLGVDRFVLTTVAWNAHVDGRELRVLKAPQTTAAPRIRGAAS